MARVGAIAGAFCFLSSIFFPFIDEFRVVFDANRMLRMCWNQFKRSNDNARMQFNPFALLSHMSVPPARSPSTGQQNRYVLNVLRNSFHSFERNGPNVSNGSEHCNGYIKRTCRFAGAGIPSTSSRVSSNRGRRRESRSNKSTHACSKLSDEVIFMWIGERTRNRTW